MGHKGTLTVVGTGIKVGAHMTLEAKFHIEHDDHVVYLVADPATRAYILELNPRAEALDVWFKLGRPRYECYAAIIQHVLDLLRKGGNVCMALYGHPGVFVYPSHAAIRLARAEGFRAVMLPGISAEDCLYADLGFDPGVEGCQVFEATEFLVYGHSLNVELPAVLWQVGVVGQLTHAGMESNPAGIRILTEVLLSFYPREHTVAIFEAAQFPVFDSRVEMCALEHLPEIKMSAITTLFVPSLRARVPDAAMLQRLNMSAPRPRALPNIQKEPRPAMPNGTNPAEIEIVECYSDEDLGSPTPSGDSLCWAKVVWVDKHTCADVRQFIGHWIARKWKPGHECPWIHNKLYRIPTRHASAYIDMKLGDFRESKPIEQLSR
jgi:tetrapyrrole (corrin/porphyrin) methylase-like protein